MDPYRFYIKCLQRLRVSFYAAQEFDFTKEQHPSASLWSTREPGNFKMVGSVVIRFRLRTFCCSWLRVMYSGECLGIYAYIRGQGQGSVAA